MEPKKTGGHYMINNQLLNNNLIAIKEKSKSPIYYFFTSKPFRSCAVILYFFGLISLFFFLVWKLPNSAVSLSLIVIVVSMAMVIIPVIRRNLASFQKGKSTRSKFLVKTTIDVSGIFLTAVSAIVLASASAGYAAPRIGVAVEASSPGLGAPAGIFSGLIIAAIVGLCVGYVVRAVWGRLTKLVA
jgi:hypothetical protein